MKEANKSDVIDSDGLVMHAQNIGTDVLRISHYIRRSTELAYMLGKSEEAYNVAMDLLKKAFEEVRVIDSNELQQENIDEPLEETNGTAHITTMHDPRVSQTKGRPRDDKGKMTVVTTAIGTTRYKSSLEKAKAKARRTGTERVCRTCHMGGHDSRTCAKRKAQRSSIDIKDAGSVQDWVDLDLGT
ncbi:hypothetical protein BVC80_6893g2 [Macleaya cordata]|uniref:Uncharacterized protein n=1 Tax=Macleaya cordata TaxID=56857 RepID=A0A200PST5_MACCD|nr:hypothetical protein BVC80_6893g2 [Macleaya cordata]